jgi:N-acetylmuramoyl-L-alanine amidase
MKHFFVFVAALAISLIFAYTPLSQIGVSSQDHEVNAVSRDFKIPDSTLDQQHMPGQDDSEELTGLVVIDPGHGGDETGAVSNSLIEKDITLDVALRLEALLLGHDIPVYMTRRDDRTMDYKERIRSANDMKATLYLSIHCDWYKSSSFRGTSTLYFPSPDLAAGNLEEKEYASIIQQELIKKLRTINRGIIDRSDLAVLNAAQMPSVLVELGFLSNKKDAGLLADDSFRQRAAEALAAGILKSLEKARGE